MMGNKAPEPGDIDVFVLTNGPDEAAIDAAMRSLDYAPSEQASRGSRVYTSVRIVKDADWYQDGRKDVQIVTHDHALGGKGLQLWDTPWDVIKTFGFTTEQFAVYLDPATSVRMGMHGYRAWSDTMTKTLTINHIIDPVRLAYRANKYGRKGYTITLWWMVLLFDHYAALSQNDRAQIALDAAEDDQNYRVGL